MRTHKILRIKFGKLGLVFSIIVLLLSLGALIIHFDNLQIQYYIFTYNWEKALQSIDLQITLTNDELYKDQLYIYHAKIIGAMSKAARVLRDNSQMQLNEAEKKVHSKYLTLYEEASKECEESLAQLKIIAEKHLPLNVMVYLTPRDYSGEYLKLTEAEADELYRQLIGAYFYLDLSLSDQRVFAFGRVKYIKGFFTPEGLAESVF